MFDTTDTPAFLAAHSAPAGHAFGVPSSRQHYDSALTEIERILIAARKLDAQLEAALAKVDRVARAEAAAVHPLVQRGARAAEDSMEYRAARADAATAMHVTEQTVASRLTRAATLTSAYPTVAAALAAGEIDIRLAATILDAGHVIGPVVFPGDTAEAGLLDPASQALVDANRAKYEARVLVEAAKTTPARLAPIARRIAEAYALEDLESRYERSRKLRRVWVTPKDDGMAELTALLPVHEAKAGESRLLQMAKRVSEIEAREARAALAAGSASAALADSADSAARSESGARGAGNTDAEPALEQIPEPVPESVPGSVPDPLPVTPRRTLNEIKADLFVDLLLNGTGENATGGSGSGTGIAAIVQVITHEAHLTDPEVDTYFDAEFGASAGAGSIDHTGAGAGLGSGPGAGAIRLPLPEIEGCGPIPASMARDLAADAGTWNQVNVNLKTGTVLTVDTYRPPAKLRRFLAARDQRCRFPGCRVPVHRCDYDHTIDAAMGGPTATNNLGALCRGHHLLKHHSRWEVKQHDNGDYEWTSPTGRTHVDEPASRVRFVPVDDLPTFEITTSAGQGTTRPETEGKGRAPFETPEQESGDPF